MLLFFLRCLLGSTGGLSAFELARALPAQFTLSFSASWHVISSVGWSLYCTR
jgi:hypothetical protein